MAVSIEELGQTIQRELTLYSTEILEAIKEETKVATKELVQKTKATAPYNTKGNRGTHYKDHIKQKIVTNTDTAFSKLWYVDGDEYRLSHLLENGHAKKNGGRVEGTHFISKAESEVLPKYEARVEEVIKNGR